MVDVQPNSTLIVVMDMSNDKTQAIHYVTKDDTDENETVRYTKGKNIIEITCANLKELYFSDEMLKDMISINFYAVDSEEFYSEYRSDVEKLKNSALNIINHDSIYNNIEGYIHCDDDCVMSSSIPFNDGWKIKVDGNETKVLTTNQAFIGCYLSKGDHKVRIYYNGKTWIEANLFKSIGLLFAVVFYVATVYKNKRSYKFGDC